VVEIALLHGDDAKVIARFEAAVRRYCKSRTRTTEDAEDAVQDTFLRYLRRSETRVRNQEAWLITAASRACADINRWHRREDSWRALPKVDGENLRDSTMRIPDTSISADPERFTIDHLVVKALLRRLNRRDRAVIVHLYLLGASQHQVARYLGVSDEYLRVVAMRARRHAAALLRNAFH
jgi:RNA polymerase sigma-70 factor (ECF subfamily)